MQTAKDNILATLARDQLAAQELYQSLMQISVDLFGGLLPEDAEAQRKQAFEVFEKVTERTEPTHSED
jgi:hypothetical protein